MVNPPQFYYPDIGELGEHLVAQWLESTGWMILHRRFYSRWGEIDIIAQQDGQGLNQPCPQLAFVEVKTRSPSNWDAGGRNAITAQKQTKIWRTAEMFLAEYPEKSHYCCRFDVAIVYRMTKLNRKYTDMEPLARISLKGYELYLQEYIQDAFS